MAEHRAPEANLLFGEVTWLTQKCRISGLSGLSLGFPKINKKALLQYWLNLYFWKIKYLLSNNKWSHHSTNRHENASIALLTLQKSLHPNSQLGIISWIYYKKNNACLLKTEWLLAVAVAPHTIHQSTTGAFSRQLMWRRPLAEQYGNSHSVAWLIWSLEATFPRWMTVAY